MIDDDMLGGLSTRERAKLLAGRDFWSTAETGSGDHRIRSISLADGPHGLRRQTGKSDHMGLNNSLPATCFPAECLSACSFDPELMYEVGRAIGEECRFQDVAVLLGPGVNIKRSPLCGRAFEYFSEDPLLSGAMGAAMVEGIQSTGVGACPKHFAANSQEMLRMTGDSVVDDRALNEIYLPAFETIVKRARPAAIMTAYNRLNGNYCSESSWLLSEKLRGEWGFEGACITDWGALSDSVESVRAGLDLAMPGPRPDHSREVEQAVLSGFLDKDALDRAASQVAGLVAMAQRAQNVAFSCDIDSHLDIARRMAEASGVLLANDGTLPLEAGSSVALLGAFAISPRYQGAGSSKINPIELDNLLDAMRKLDCKTGYAPGYDRNSGETSAEMLEEAERIARNHDVAVVLVGLPDAVESEGFDRDSLEMPGGHIALIERACLANPRTVVVLFAGSALELPWITRSNGDGTWGESCAPTPSAVLAMYLPGCRGATATARLLLGLANPSGKLTETWPVKLADTALGTGFPDASPEVLYRESIYVGYRWFDSAGIEPAFPFGHGLSYTSFEYSDLEVSTRNGSIEVAIRLTNTGSVAGSETVQVYVHPIDPLDFMADQQLAGFKKVRLGPNKSAEIRISLDTRAFCLWDDETKRWAMGGENFEIRVGSSSRDIRLTAHMKPETDAPGCLPALRANRRSCYDHPELEPYFHVHEKEFSDESFEALYGRPLPSPPPAHPFTRNSPIGSLRETRTGRFIHKLILRIGGRVIDPNDGDVANIMESSLSDMPLRSMTMAGISMEVVDGLVDIANHQVLIGVRAVIKGLLSKKR